MMVGENRRFSSGNEARRGNTTLEPWKLTELDESWDVRYPNRRSGLIGSEVTLASTSLFRGASRAKTIAAYAAMIVIAIAMFVLIRSYGEQLSPSRSAQASDVAPRAVAHGDVLAQVLLSLAVIVLMARFVGRAVEKYLRQPPVMGEILAGLMLGPSVLAALSPGAYALFMPQEAASYLGIVAKIGVVLFMFLVGVELDASPIRRHPHSRSRSRMRA